MIIVGAGAAQGRKTTVFDLIKGALRPLNVLTGNTTLTDEEAQDALEVLNWMLESWSTLPQAIFHVQRITGDLTSGKNPHTIGPGGDIDAQRPTRVIAASLRVVNVDYPLAMLQADDYEAIRLKNLQTAWPVYGYLEQTFPLASLWLWPIPTGNSIALQCEFPLLGFDRLTDEVVLPPGYADAIRYNLAVRLADEYQIDVPQNVGRLAAASLQAIARANRRSQTMSVDPMLRRGNRGRYLVFSDGYR